MNGCQRVPGNCSGYRLCQKKKNKSKPGYSAAACPELLRVSASGAQAPSAEGLSHGLLLHKSSPTIWLRVICRPLAGSTAPVLW